ncbi:MAG TPA: hypothetical protein VN950_05200 [Terriglobales bacterium]|nr:hypothetical protein [Terriglobales bacterium]
MPLKTDLKSFVGGVPEYAKWNHAEKVKFFAWYLHVYEKKARVNGVDIAACYDALHDEQPSSIAPFLVSMEKKNPKEAIRDGSSGYYLSKQVRDDLDGKYGKRGTTIAVDKALAELPGRIPDKAEKEFLQEVLVCFNNAACRAAIVMMWNLTYFHLVHYILKHKLAEFNAAYPIRLGGTHKKAKVPVLAKYEDFSVDLEESEVLAVAKAAGAITHDQWKILDTKLGRRNSAAHPSTVAFLPITTEEYILDLATNIILALPL